MSLLGAILSLAQLFMKARAENNAARFTLATDRIKQLGKATADEIARAQKADDIADSDPDAGRL